MSDDRNGYRPDREIPPVMGHECRQCGRNDFDNIVEAKEHCRSTAVRTDGGSKYVRETGEGYETVVRVGHESTVISITTIESVDWPPAKTVYFRAGAEGVRPQTTPPLPDDRLAAPTRVSSGQGGRRITLPRAVVRYLSVRDGEDIRVYTDEEGLLLVSAQDDPRVGDGDD